MKDTKELKDNKLMLSAVGIATGAIAAATYVLFNKKKLFGNKKEKKPLEKLQDIVQKSRTNVEDILNTINTEAYKATKNGKAKLGNVL